MSRGHKISIKIGDALLKIGVDKGDFDRDMNSIGETFKKHQKAIGVAMMAAGVAIVGGLAMALKAAAAEEAGIGRLRVAMENVGLSYDESSKSLEKWINAQQQSTAFADSEQRASLSSLIILTGNLTKAQDLLTTAMDVARWKNMDLATASDLLMKVYAGDMGMLKRYGIIVKEGSTNIEALAQIQKMAGGQAKAYGNTLAGQMQLLKNNMGDVGEAIGGVLIPIVKSLFDKIMPIIEGIKEWTAAHPGLTKVIVISTGVLGLLLVALGTYLVLSASATVQTMLLTAKLVVHKFALIAATASQWAFNASLTATAGLLAGLTAGIGMIVWGFTQLKSNADLARESQQKLLDLNREIAKAWKGEKSNAIEMLQATLDEVRAKHELGTATQNELKWLIEEEKHYESIIAQLKARQKAQETLATVSERTTDEMIDDLKTLNAEAKRRATESTNANIQAIDKWMDAETDKHNTLMSNLDKEYSAQLRNIDLQLGITLSIYQGQIDAINQLTEDENLARTKADEKIRLLELQAAVDSAETAEDKTAAIKELWEYQTEVNRNELLRQRDDEIQALRDSMDVARKKADNEKTQAEIAYEANKTRLTNEYNDTIKMLKDTKTSLDTALTEQLTRYDTDLLAYDENLRLKKLSYTQFIKDYNAAIAALAPMPTPTPPIPSITRPVTPTSPITSPLKTYALGGIIPEPTLLTSVRTMRPYAIAGEAGAERISPLGKNEGYRTANIFFQVDGRTLARVMGKPLVDEILIRQGIR